MGGGVCVFGTMAVRRQSVAREARQGKARRGMASPDLRPVAFVQEFERDQVWVGVFHQLVGRFLHLQMSVADVAGRRVESILDPRQQEPIQDRYRLVHDNERRDAVEEGLVLSRVAVDT